MTLRKALSSDVPILWKLRREAILSLAPASGEMTAAQSEDWAAALTIQAMERRLLDNEVWLAESNDAVIGWVAYREDSLDGLYVSPQFAGQGVGTTLLNFAERSMQQTGIKVVRTEASVNAQGFYLRRGFARTEDARPGHAIPMTKILSTSGYPLQDRLVTLRRFRLEDAEAHLAGEDEE